MKTFKDSPTLGKGNGENEELKAAYQRIGQLEVALATARSQLITLGGNDPEGCQIQQYILGRVDNALFEEITS